MTKKLLLAAGSLMLLLGTIALQGCFDSGPGYGPGYYASGPAYYPAPTYYSQAPTYYSQPAYVGDYDEQRTWHDRDWWVNNRRDWVQDHHQDWLAIQQGQANIRHDKQELREDLQNRDYNAAAHEKAEIQQRRENVRERKADLYGNPSDRY